MCTRGNGANEDGESGLAGLAGLGGGVLDCRTDERSGSAGKDNTDDGACCRFHGTVDGSPSS